MELRPKQLLKDECPGLEMVGDSPHEVIVALDFPMETATLMTGDSERVLGVV